MTTKTYRASTLKRIRRTADQIEQLDAQIISVAEQSERQHLIAMANRLGRD